MDGVYDWEALAQPAHLARRMLRYLGVDASERAYALFIDYEPFFADTGAAAAALRQVLSEVGARATVHSAWLGRPELVGAAAERWLDGLHGHEWWSREITWRSVEPDLRLLAMPDSDNTSVTLFAWSDTGKTFLDEVLGRWEQLPKVAPEEHPPFQ